MTTVGQFIRFTIIGGFATLIQYAVLIALVQGGGINAVTASSVGFVLSAVVNYALNRRITFRSDQPHAKASPRFATVAVGGLAVNAGLIWLFHVAAGLHYLLAQVLATIGTLLWNFALNRAWTFAARPAEHW